MYKQVLDGFACLVELEMIKNNEKEFCAKSSHSFIKLIANTTMYYYNFQNEMLLKH